MANRITFTPLPSRRRSRWRNNWPTAAAVEAAALAELAARSTATAEARRQAAGDAPPFDRIAWLLGQPTGERPRS